MRLLWTPHLTWTRQCCNTADLRELTLISWGKKQPVCPVHFKKTSPIKQDEVFPGHFHNEMTDIPLLWRSLKIIGVLYFGKSSHNAGWQLGGRLLTLITSPSLRILGSRFQYNFLGQKSSFNRLLTTIKHKGKAKISSWILSRNIPDEPPCVKKKRPTFASTFSLF